LSTSDISDVSDLSDTDTDTANSGTQTLHGVRSDLSAAYDHAWLKNFTTTCGPLLHSDTSTEIDIFSHFFSADLIDVLSEKRTVTPLSVFQNQLWVQLRVVVGGLTSPRLTCMAF